MKVYIVTTGDYSDYMIKGVFSTLEKAKKYIEAINKTNAYPHTNEVEIYDVDEIEDFRITTEINMSETGVADKYADKVVNGSPGFKGFFFPNQFSWGVDTDDYDRAVKVVNEKRVQILAAGLWGKDKAVRELFGQSEAE